MEWERLKEYVRPEGVHRGVMKVDPELCTGCELCVANCPFKCWEMTDDGYPRLREGYVCFTCSNCMVACAVDAISIVSPYYVSGGVWATEPHPLPVKMPVPPKDKDGKPDQWNAVERLVLQRRSVRNFKDEPVPDHLIRRVLEAGRFAPSAGNCQPWQFVVITNRELIRKMDEAVIDMAKQIWAMYTDDELVKNMGPIAETTPYAFDPRPMWGGVGTIARGDMVPSLNAPCVVLLAGDARAVTGPHLNIGICGQNMNLVANSLGLGVCWNGFLVSGVPAIADKIRLQPNWSVITTLVLGWPAFQQHGMVAREFRPVIWLREGSEEPQIEE